MEGVTQGIRELTSKVERDPIAQRLAELDLLTRALKGAKYPDAPGIELSRYLDNVRPFREEADTLKKLLLIGLYEKGAEVLAAQGSEIKTCPLCGNEYRGELAEHVRQELERLTALRNLHRSVEEQRRRAMTHLKGQDRLEGLRDVLSRVAEGDKLKVRAAQLSSRTSELARRRAELLRMVELESQELDAEGVQALRKTSAIVENEVLAYEGVRVDLLSELERTTRELASNKERTRLVNDHHKARAGMDSWLRHKRQVDAGRILADVVGSFGALVEGFITGSSKDVLQRFDQISDTVTKYFETLESRTTGIGRPVLRILLDQDRAVVPEILFHGQTVSPAYRYLSESQLNSFGLAVFLASVRRFNPDFRFLILDDVVNSFDGYKRPELLKLLKADFRDFQVILLTHDRAWRDQLYKHLPEWNRMEFIRLDFGVGPIQGQALETLEQVKELIANDNPKLAGQALGPYMEFYLQDICEAFEVEVKYNRRNEYTLEPLLDRLRIRTRSKLGAEHDLTRRLDALYQDSGFRNLTAHAKNPEIELTPEEMAAVLDKWVAVEQLARCQKKECYEILRYTPAGDFRCPCSQSCLRKPIRIGE
jgi:hypothetical protein